jgi:hypothetical protein
VSEEEEIEQEITEIVTMGYSRKECVDTIAKTAFMRGKALTLALLMEEVEKVQSNNCIQLRPKFIPLADLKAIVEKLK